MADWDVLEPVEGEQQLEEEEEWFEYEEEVEDEEVYDGAYDFLGGPSPVFPASAAPVRESPLFKMSRYDRVHYRHKRGDGIRKGQQQNGQNIADQLYMYAQGCGSYNDRVDELRLSNAEDLMGDVGDTNAVRDMTTGAGSKIITITKVPKGSFKKHHGNIHAILKEKISQKTDMDARHYYDHVSHQLMEDGQFVQAKYDEFHNKAMEDRATQGIGNSKEMNSLYCFWCFYLRAHFNEDMYEEFLRLAREDVSEKSGYGMECFFRFASYGLEGFWNESVYKDFESEAMNDYKRGSLYGMEKLKAFHLNHHHTFEIPINPQIKAILDKYPTTKSFHEDTRPKRTPSSGSSKHAAAKAAAKAMEKAKEVPKMHLGGNKQPPAGTAQAKPEQKAPQRSGSGSQKRDGNKSKNTKGGDKKETPKRANTGWAMGTCTQPASLPFDSPMRRKWAK